jgi:hypothetical protein
MIPLNMRRSSLRSGPGWFVGKCGTTFDHCSSVNQNKFESIDLALSQLTKPLNQTNLVRVWTLALQLHIPFDVSLSRDFLMYASPNGPCNDVSGVDPSLGQADGDAADFLDRPTDQWR